MADASAVANQAWNIMIDMVSSGDADIEKILRQAATQYLAEIEVLQVEITDFTALLKARSKYTKMAKNGQMTEHDVLQLTHTRALISDFLQGDIPKRLYETAFAFQQLLNSVLGQTVKMVYVFQGKEGPELYEVLNEDILSFDTSSRHQLVARYNANSKNFQSALKKLELTEKTTNYDPKGLINTYNETVRRYNISRAHNNHVVLCKPNGVWYVTKVSSLGDINEAYAAVVILNQPTPTFKSDLEQNIYDFLMGFVSQVDNISGLLQGDVSKDGIEYGIKSAGASTLGLAQMKKLAQEILATPGFDKNKLLEVKQRFAAKGKLRNKIERMEEDTWDELIDLIQFDK